MDIFEGVHKDGKLEQGPGQLEKGPSCTLICPYACYPDRDKNKSSLLYVIWTYNHFSTPSFYLFIYILTTNVTECKTMTNKDVMP